MGNIKEKVGVLIAVLIYAFVLNTFALHPAYAEEILYEDDQIVVKYSGAYSKRTGNPLQFRQAPDWEEEDFFTQQEKYCEIGEKDGIQRQGNGSL